MVNKYCRHDDYTYRVKRSPDGYYVYECNQCDGIIYNQVKQIPKLGKDLVTDEVFIMLEYEEIHKE